MVEAAMGTILADVREVREIIVQNPTAARQGVHKAAFAELRNAFLRFGGTMTAKFLDLEREIDDYSVQFVEIPTQFAGVLTRVGNSVGLSDQLNKIELKAADLRDEAAQAMKKASAVLAETQDD